MTIHHRHVVYSFVIPAAQKNVIPQTIGCDPLLEQKDKDAFVYLHNGLIYSWAGSRVYF